jgi:hypothetical protein
VATVVAACGGGGDGAVVTDPTDGADVATTSTAPTTTPTTTTTIVSSPPTEPPPTEPPPAATAPPTTLDLVALDQQIRADFERTWAGYNECGYEPADCDYRAVAIPGSEVDRTLRSFVQDLLVNNLRVGRDSGPASVSILGVAPVDSDTADVTACATDGLVLFDIGDPANPGDDIVLNDALNSYLGVWRMAEIRGEWRRVEILSLQRFMGKASCDA